MPSLFNISDNIRYVLEIKAIDYQSGFWWVFCYSIIDGLLSTIYIYFFLTKIFYFTISWRIYNFKLDILRNFKIKNSTHINKCHFFPSLFQAWQYLKHHQLWHHLKNSHQNCWWIFCTKVFHHFAQLWDVSVCKFSSLTVWVL